MEKIDIRPIIKAAHETVKSHELCDGAFCRWLWQNEAGTRKLGKNEYGCADAINILYTIGEFGCDEETRRARIEALRSMQDPKTGMFSESTHHTIHTTAHCLAALELFDALPLYPVRGLHQYMDRESLFAFLDGLDWCEPWSQSHRGAGIYAALANAGEMTEEFHNNYFEWMWENADPVTGFWKSGYADKAPYVNKQHPDGLDNPDSIHAYMAGGFHYLFNHEYAKMPLRYPDKVIDTCIRMYEECGVCDSFYKNPGFIEVDFIYCLNRASRQTPHRYGEVKEILYEVAKRHVGYISALDFERNERFNDLHMLFGCLCGMAELQAALPGVIVSEKPLRLVLDRRPFI